MNDDLSSQADLPVPPDRRTPWRVIGASFFFLVVGLGGMWLHYFLKDRAAVGLGTPDQLPPAAPIEHSAANRVRLFFTADGALLSPEMAEIARNATIYERASAIVQALIRGPRSAALRSPIPRGVKLLGLYIGDGSATADFSADLRNGLRGGAAAETLCIYCIVNSLLLNCSDLRTVTVLIEGHPIETLLGYLDLSEPLVENLALLAEEKNPSE
jgi:hypothetical protein